jgi:hypothetical protein
LIAPPGRSRLLRRTARATSSKVSLWRRRASSLTSMRTSYGRTAASSICEISGRPASASRASSASRFSVRSSASPWIVTLMTSLRFTSRDTTGSSMSAGKFGIASMRSFTSASTRSRSASCSVSTTTSPAPSLALDVTLSTPVMPSTASSTRRHTPCSTSAVVAPG